MALSHDFTRDRQDFNHISQLHDSIDLSLIACRWENNRARRLLACLSVKQRVLTATRKGLCRRDQQRRGVGQTNANSFPNDERLNELNFNQADGKERK